MERKTKKYYIGELRKDIYSASKVIGEVITKYLSYVSTTTKNIYYPYSHEIKDRIKETWVYRTAYANSDNEFWNCRIAGFTMRDYKKGTRNVSDEVGVRIYWQGDSTDGYEYVALNDLLRTNEYVIRTEYSDATERIVHDRLRIQRDWLKSAFNEVANQLEKQSKKKK